MNWRELKPHALNVYPKMDEQEYNELKESLKKGFDYRMPIMVFEDAVIDGANRLRACLELDIVPLVKEFIGTVEEARDYILKTNVRRNLTAGQRAAVILDMTSVVNDLIEKAAKRSQSNLSQFNRGHAGMTSGKTDKVLGQMAGVGQSTVEYTKKVKKNDPQLYEAVKSGQISAKSAYNQMKQQANADNAEYQIQLKAKNLLKNAVSEAVEEAQQELFDEVVELFRQGNQTINFKLKLVKA